MISYYPNMKDFNETFDRLVWYLKDDPDAERKVQAIYEVCYKIYLVGVKHGMEEAKKE